MNIYEVCASTMMHLVTYDGQVYQVTELIQITNFLPLLGFSRCGLYIKAATAVQSSHTILYTTLHIILHTRYHLFYVSSTVRGIVATAKFSSINSGLIIDSGLVCDAQ